MKAIQYCCFFLLAVMPWRAAPALAQGVMVKAHVVIATEKGRLQGPDRDSSIVFWLTPVKGWEGPPPHARESGQRPQLVQRHKQFVPHVLAVEAGSVVDFPNHDPFFHNVFSLFDGKRFDLGLYEAGSTRSVHFDRPGICYIFCNIHPQMSAIVVVVDTPYFAVSNGQGDVAIPNVPPGRYKLDLWAERCASRTLQAASRTVDVGSSELSLGTIQLEESRELVMVHPNKYGRSYDPEVFSSPIYAQP